MRVYFDSSALVKRGLQEDESVALSKALKEFESVGDGFFSSSLAWIEVSRNAVQLSNIAATHRLEIRGNGECAKIEVHSN